MRRSLKRFKDKLFFYLVEKNPYILKSYQDYRWNNEHIHSNFRFVTWTYIIGLNVYYRILRKKSDEQSVNRKSSVAGDAFKKSTGPYPVLRRTESSIQKRESIQHFAKRLVLNYDVISFDIFDTLILRPLANPEDLFLMLAEKHGYLDFADIRHKEEKFIRSVNMKKNGSREVTFEEIYDRVSKYTGIDKEYGMKVEFELEMDLCFANPYMLEVFEILKNNKKKIIAVSDMYLPKDMVKQLLEKCGFQGFEEIFVSCDYGCSKRDKGLYKIVDEQLTNGLKVMHIGDNFVSDVKHGREFGWDTFYYRNVHYIGNQFRAQGMSSLVGSAYAGVVNTHLHNGYDKYNPHYEFGFTYGGLFILGYCRFIHEYKKKNNIDKVLFLSRDGDIIKKVYDKLFPHDKTEYVYWSRIASSKISSVLFRYDFIFQYVTLRSLSKDKFTASEMLETMDITFLLGELEELGIYANTIINESLSEIMENFIIKNWSRIIDSYKDNIEAAKLYFKEVIGECRKVAIVDVGWRGSGAIGIKALVEKLWKMDCEIVGLLAGSSKQEYKSNIAQITNGELVSYLFSQRHNLDNFNFQLSNSLNNSYVELFTSACHPSLKGFRLNEQGNYEFEFDVPEVENYKMISEVHKGIMDFVDKYRSHFKEYDYMLNISGHDAYQPIRHILRDSTYIKKFFGEYTFNRLTGSKNAQMKFSTFSEIISSRKI